MTGAGWALAGGATLLFTLAPPAHLAYLAPLVMSAGALLGASR